ncbi:nicotinate-nucleotide--dimethylbenzimidazole phosphoribosyltransferase [Vibrio mangrovi]|uniref:Nicotinate-nucleotide--dimethylbenzimidazole phosphoribosyltransferase n=1 Tax=Vibrio mangrovi TaxID=474394 RepID=A0A1Y6IY54_9VIBR|nr:nicotinate-nucleotide--dimethylbenzimidazole phosphoribosyltransferase [Vibrio mangrovi]MDW6005203.1 nicotinate-nucleotide--dimethylbenzimidazole phosphoribosyltransferase [Vibrio mangrovi]SMS02587.1 Nicotinate-nucleotide--dimethylbenzimidazole phosphoribosyltransferase [Vibrio mangrovi]
MNPQLTALKASIFPVDETIRQMARAHVDRLFKPVGSLGQLEVMACQLAAIYRTTEWKTGKKKIFVMAGDHGVFAENVAVTPQEVTAIQAVNTVHGLTGVAAISHSLGIDVEMIDVGIDGPAPDGVTDMKVAQGCGNIFRQAAMTYQQAEQLILDTAEYVRKTIDTEQLSVIGIGELGIANTTPAAAIVSVLTGKAPQEVVGLGANLPSSRLRHKEAVVAQAIALNQPDRNDPIDVMAKVGGFDLAGMSGAILGAAAMKTPVVLDGFLSYASAMIACLIEPNVWDYLIPSHVSAEKGAAIALEYLRLKPFIHMELRLGEGSGAALAMPFIDAAHAIYHRMGKMEENGIDLPGPV